MGILSGGAVEVGERSGRSGSKRGIHRSAHVILVPIPLCPAAAPRHVQIRFRRNSATPLLSPLAPLAPFNTVTDGDDGDGSSKGRLR